MPLSPLALSTQRCNKPLPAIAAAAAAGVSTRAAWCAGAICAALKRCVYCMGREALQPHAHNAQPTCHRHAGHGATPRQTGMRPTL